MCRWWHRAVRNFEHVVRRLSVSVVLSSRLSRKIEVEFVRGLSGGESLTGYGLPVDVEGEELRIWEWEDLGLR